VAQLFGDSNLIALWAARRDRILAVVTSFFLTPVWHAGHLFTHKHNNANAVELHRHLKHKARAYFK
jgi:hypothetical protein